jgi:nucleoside-diphosphate-sugar epimerase
MKICFTGGTGFVGTALLRALVARQLDISLITNRTNLNLPAGSEVKLIKADLLSESGRRVAIEQSEADTLLHLAWYAEFNLFWQSPVNLDWLYASLDILRLFAEQGGKRVIILGSGTEYDWSASGCFHEYSSPVSPYTYYGQCKDALRRAAMGYASIRGLSFLWGRLFWPYGPGETQGRLLTSLALKMLNNQPAVCRAGSLKRDYIFIEDVADALATVVCSPLEGILNIASGESVSLGFLSEKLADIMGTRRLLQVETVPTSPGNPEDIKANVQRLRQDLNWKPRYSIEEGLKLFADHIIRAENII